MLCVLRVFERNGSLFVRGALCSFVGWRSGTFPMWQPSVVVPSLVRCALCGLPGVSGTELPSLGALLVTLAVEHVLERLV